tara:strand:- start:1850 stop:2113 length:264 start_codon:yes stop_codon:yes gene_type:complete
MHKIYIKGRSHIGNTRYLRGRGLLLDNGNGYGNSYSSLDDYQNTTQNGRKKLKGMGLNENFTSKLANLNIGKQQPFSRKPKNISFNL